MNNLKDDMFRGRGVLVELKNSDDFLKVRETLSRIGIASESSKKLFQSCHILHKRGKYVVIHFKELFALDGKRTEIEESDLARRNRIVHLLEEWELVKIVDRESAENPMASMGKIKIVPYKEKEDWELVAKYNIGKRRGYQYDDQ